MATIYHDDTIVARATPAGEGAIAVLRVSGADAITLLDSIFKGKATLTEAAGNTAHYGKLVNLNGEHIDDVVATVFRKPHSYTGEDSVEVSCHGGLYITQLVLDTIIASGVRQAEPGEFTKRAYLNKKLDLSQAEAVADLIAARSEAARRASLSQLEGKFSTTIEELRSELMDLCSLIELELDFSEEGLDLISKADVLRRIDAVNIRIYGMIDSYRAGRIYREGLSVVIIGKPNVGKSSLFNALITESRAIVTNVPGTTRDSLEENIMIGGVLFRLHDTAGLRETTDPVEYEGVLRTKKLMGLADVLLLVVDGSPGPDRDAAQSFLGGADTPNSVIVIYNKMDLCKHLDFEPRFTKQGETSVDEVLASAQTGAGIDLLRKKLLARVTSDKPESEGLQLMNVRHRDSLEKASRSLLSASQSIGRGIPGEFAAFDIRVAADALAEIVGAISTDEMLHNIFDRFCIGK